MRQINPDDYEGHTPGPWEWYDDYITEAHGDGSYIARMECDYKKEDAILMTDAPLLLEEVKKLRKQLREAEDVIRYALDMTSDDDAKSVFEDFLEVNE